MDSTYSPYNASSSVPPPPPSLNGGLYTGEPFLKGAPWGNVPVIPDVSYMTHVNLRSANPPLAAIYQYPGNIRPGNNFQEMPGVSTIKKYNVQCSTPSEVSVQKCPCNKCKFSGHYYL